MFWLALVANACLIVRSEMCIDEHGQPLAWSDRFCSTDARDVVIWWSSPNATDIPADFDAGPNPQNPPGMFGITGNANEVQYNTAVALQGIIFAFGILMALSSVIIFLLYSLKEGLPRVRRRWHYRTGRRGAMEELAERSRSSLSVLLYFYSQSVLDFLLEFRLLYYATSFSCVVVGLVFSPFWFCVGLLDLFRMNEGLHDVAIALGTNAKAIVFTFLFALVIIYIYALLGYILLADAMVLEESGLPVCTSLWQCILSATDRGLRSGDMGSLFTPLPSPDLVGRETMSSWALFEYYFNVFYAFTFWFIVVIILLNAIFGIIIDSFSELRTRRKEIKKKNETECFVCGIERFRLDTKGGGFVRHITLHHNMWNYLRMISMLREKDENEYSGWESHIANCLAENDTSFLPQDALSLRAVTEMELAEEQQKSAQATKTASTVVEMSTSLAALQERQDETAGTVAAVSASLNEMKGLQATLQQTINAMVLQTTPSSSPLRPTSATVGLRGLAASATAAATATTTVAPQAEPAADSETTRPTSSTFG